MYPAAKVDVSVHAPLPYSGGIDAQGSGWSQVLNALVQLRANDGAPPDVYYMGVFEPASSFQAYCGGGCIAGLCGIGQSPADATVRACVGIGYSGAESATTAAHEVGHAHGRSHAPCGGASSPDPNFPYSGGGIGSWGYDLNTKQLIDPSQGKDIMGYCQPTWISDYNYDALFSRMQAVNGAHNIVNGQFPKPVPYRFLVVDDKGNASWGDRVSLKERPMSEEHTVSYFDAHGNTVETVMGHYWQYDHLPGGFMLVPDPPSNVARVQIAGLPQSAQLEVPLSL
jgi:hypothetical protein